MTASDLYTETTNRIIAALEKGGLPPWRKPWLSGEPSLPLRHNGTPYRGINTLILMIEGDFKGYTSPHWLTFRQAKEYGGAVKAGEKSTPILFCQPMTKKETADDGEEAEARFWLSKTYRVFNALQCEGLPERFTVKPPTHQLDISQRIEQADAYIRNTGAAIHLGGGAYYNPADDFINLPLFETFDSPESFYATALHEATHWTGHRTRLGRELGIKHGRPNYAKEEIIAELASVLLCAQIGIMPPTLDNHAAYLDFWIRDMRQDARYLFTAAAAAQKAVDFLNGLQPQPE
jgi:antirestriction protein ArdC